MRSFSCLFAASLLSLAPRLASAQDAPPVAPVALPPAPQAAPAAPDAPPPVVVTPPADGATVIVFPSAAPPLTAPPPPPVWHMAPTSDPPAMRRRNTKLMVGGLVMIPVGIAMAVGGGVLIHDIQNKPSNCQPSSDPSLGGAIGSAFCGLGEGIGRSMDLTGAYTLALMGGGVAVAGIVMASVGGQVVPQRGFRPSVGVGAGSVCLKWSF